MKTKSLYFLFFLTLVFSLIKVDYRFKEIPYGLEVDDAEYYYSAVTIGIDFDLDFSNQMKGVDNRFLNFENNKMIHILIDIHLHPKNLIMNHRIQENEYDRIVNLNGVDFSFTIQMTVKFDVSRTS